MSAPSDLHDSNSQFNAREKHWMNVALEAAASAMVILFFIFFMEFSLV